MELTIDEIKETLPELLELISEEQKEQIKLYQEIIASRPHLNKFDISNVGHFYLCFIRPLNKFVDFFIKRKISTDFDIGFIYKNSRYLESSFANIITRVEGGAASSDKARRILAALVHHFKTGEPIVWDYSHEDSWCMPKQVFTNHDQIIAFYEGLSCLQQGNYTAYLQALATLLPLLTPTPAPAPEAEPPEAATSPPVNQYNPDVVSPPRETLLEMLLENLDNDWRGWGDVYRVLMGATITKGIAESLEWCFDRKPRATFWLERQRLYDEAMSDKAPEPAEAATGTEAGADIDEADKINTGLSMFLRYNYHKASIHDEQLWAGGKVSDKDAEILEGLGWYRGFDCWAIDT